ncbi:hypothetical protein AK973_5503 [Pseudomonas brassicacearum]|nr:hypothetical protein AK973_5503 [Pseudomonas brassicacearum]
MGQVVGIGQVGHLPVFFAASKKASILAFHKYFSGAVGQIVLAHLS